MLKFEDEKQLDDFLYNFENEMSKDDKFLQSTLKKNLDLYKKLKQKEKQIDDILIKKRSEIQESLRYISETVETSLRIFFDFEILKEEEKKYLKINIFGKFLLNETTDNYIRSNENEMKDKNNLIPNFSFFKILKKVEIIPEKENFLENPLKLDLRIIKKMKNRSDLKNLKGFSIKRLIKQEEEMFPLNIKIKICLENYSKIYKINSPLKEFINKDYALRKEIFEFLWLYIKNNKLMEKNVVKLDTELLKIFTPEEGEMEIEIHEMGIQIKDLLGGEEILEFDFEIFGEEKFFKCFEKKINLPLDVTKECMAFFAEKLLFDGNEKKKIFNNEQNDVNYFIEMNEKNKDLQKEIYLDFNKFYKILIKRENYKKFQNNIPEFLKNFLETQNENLKILQSNSSSVLRKRNWNDENDFLDNLFNNYENVLDREIENFLKPKVE